MDPEFKLPHLRSYLKFPGRKTKKSVFFDAKFYPYARSQQVFAAVGGSEILICRVSAEKASPLEILLTIRDFEDVPIPNFNEPLLNSCTWSDIDNVPLLAVGGWAGKVKVYNTINAKLEQTLIGHGSEVNDLCTHPIYPYIIASGSADHSIRIWSLLPEHRKNPCLLILGHGQAHKEGILTCAFHQTGRYLISGGLDHMICVWTLPNLSLEETASWDETKVIHFPHFITQAVHGNFVDCVLFHGDLILSKAAEEDKIVLWMITGFSSALSPPTPETAPVTNVFRDTRSGFLANVQHDPYAADQEVQPFQRLLSLSAPDSISFYMRFSILRPTPEYPNLHPMVAFMNTKTKLMVWDLKRLRLGHDGELSTVEGIVDGIGKGKGRKRTSLLYHRTLAENGGLGLSPSRSSRQASTEERSSSLVTESNTSFSLPSEVVSTTATSINGVGPPPPPLLLNDRVYDISDPFTDLKAHQIITIPKYPKHVTARQATWSTDGKWLVVVGESGDDGIIALYSR